MVKKFKIYYYRVSGYNSAKAMPGAFVLGIAMVLRLNVYFDGIKRMSNQDTCTA